MTKERGETPTPDEPPREPAQPGSWRPEDMTQAAGQMRAPTTQSGLGGCLGILGKMVLTFIIGVFVLGGLIFATCFLAMQR
ncbi:MAG TPA: hypothetical protein VI258_06405 [Rhodanobacteraceae bacterium]